uniref:thiamine biosynthesis protein S n=1 Tax=Cocconeiopsis kantsiensis TaxID=3082010 RepID=UPI0030018056
MITPKYFFLNGQKYFTESEVTLLDLITYFNYSTSLLVVEYNNLICKKQDWSQINIINDDRIEIVTIVGGG